MWMIAARPPISLRSARGQPCWTNGGQAAPDHALAHRVCPPAPVLHPHTHRPTSIPNLKYSIQDNSTYVASPGFFGRRLRLCGAIGRFKNYRGSFGVICSSAITYWVAYSLQAVIRETIVATILLREPF